MFKVKQTFIFIKQYISNKRNIFKIIIIIFLVSFILIKQSASMEVMQRCVKVSC